MNPELHWWILSGFGMLLYMYLDTGTDLEAVGLVYCRVVTPQFTFINCTLTLP